jgi:hypothetical protein
MIAEVIVGYPLQPNEKKGRSTNHLWRPCRLMKDGGSDANGPVELAHRHVA